MSRRGSIILELLVALALATPVFLALAAALHTDARLMNAVSLDTRDQLRASEYAALLKRSMLEVDSQPYLPPRVHHGGKITFANGHTVPLAGVHAMLKNSDAISILKLDINKTMRVQALSGSSLYACFRFKNSANLSDYKGFLGFSADGPVELVGHASGSGKCRHLSVSAQPGMFTTAFGAGALSFIRVLVPIERNYTLYIDKHHELRYLGMSASKVIENQPIIGGINGLKIQAQTTLIPNLKAYASTLTLKQPLELLHLPHLARVSFLNFTGNLP